MQPYLPARWVTASIDTLNRPDVYPAARGAGLMALKTPIWSTSIATSSSGRERRQQRWSYPRWSFKIPYEVISDHAADPEVHRLWAFFNMAAGQAGEFLLRDASDHVVSGQPFGTGDGITTTFQLRRTMAVGAISFSEPVFGVVGTPTILVNGTETAAFAIGSNGLITFSSPPAAGATLAWTGQFLFLVRFAADQLDTAQMMQGLWSSGGISLMSVKR